jgi:CubicO group peptidase (beta-lactamase class C family)
LINNQEVRRQVEDYMATLYPGAAMQSYKLFDGDSLLQKGEAHYNDIVKKEGYDGIVLMRQTGENTDYQFVAGRPPAYLNTWSGYWRGGWGNRWAGSGFEPGTPGHTQTDHTWHVQVAVYSLMANKLIWAANTITTNPGGRIPLFEDVCNAVKKEMKKEGFFH